MKPGEQLAKWRRQQGMGLDDLAKSSGIRMSRLHQIEEENMCLLTIPGGAARLRAVGVPECIVAPLCGGYL